MSSFRVRPFEQKKFDEWNVFVEKSNEGTIFHRLDFLAYHNDKFKENEHHLMIYKGESLFGVMTLAIFIDDGRRIAKSPYGASYGGPIFRRVLNYADSCKIVTVILYYLKEIGVEELLMTFPIFSCYQRYSETFRFALMEQGFQCVNRDISSVVCLDQALSLSAEMSSRARNMARKARKAGIEIVSHADWLDFWMVMDITFQRHGTQPTHSKEEFICLHNKFPERVYTDVAYFDGKPVAGIGYFVVNSIVNSSFYLCQDPEFQNTQAQSLLIYEAILESQKHGYKWFDFGTSSVNMKGRENIFKFKESFGSVGQFRETYKWCNK